MLRSDVRLEELAAGDVHVWTAPLRAPATLAALLDGEERLRAAQLVRELDRDRFVAAHGILRRLLGRYLDCDPAAIAFRYGEHGKPALAAPAALAFNMSHSGDLVAYAFARVDVGIDIEASDARPNESLAALASRVMSPNELAAWRTCGDARAGFYRLWTRKEAYVKARGLALGFAPQSTIPDDDPDFSVIDVELASGYAAALALRGPCARVSRYALDASGSPLSEPV